MSPEGRSARFELRHPLAIFSRLALNGLLLERAVRAGVDVRKERVTQNLGRGRETGSSPLPPAHTAQPTWCWPRARAILFAASSLSPISPDDLMVTAGYFIPGDSSLVQIQFLKNISGYIWVFPRPDHFRPALRRRWERPQLPNLRRQLEAMACEQHASVSTARAFYSHILPAFRTQTLDEMKVCGDGWTMIGDSAGLVDPITGEGLYYALRSAELCARSAAGGQTGAVSTRDLEEEILA